ncbi:hypothetical protein [Fodinicola acaciae]|uniref:hypothetical protein n=1 Tax=Fodinicola acaciae TaxID=2681555 RepID=UPI0013D82AA5|nr:hypothetical protein [Fodinicola acaciae]
MRTDWREVVRAGSDLAIIGFVVLLLSLPILTAGAALGAGSAAVRHWCDHRSLPSARAIAGWFGRGLLPGLGATVAAFVVATALFLDVRAVAAGIVPGGMVALAVTVLATAYVIGIAALTVVQVGRTDGRHWIAGLRTAVRLERRTAAATAILCVLVVMAVFLGSVLPATTPLVVAFALFAAHVTTRRIGV